MRAFADRILHGIDVDIDTAFASLLGSVSQQQLLGGIARADVIEQLRIEALLIAVTHTLDDRVNLLFARPRLRMAWAQNPIADSNSSLS
ncbi:MAG: hypothetical protein MO852_07345 [Candidatus Devosia euplotis]|nr:hypothetical protein [Candidatus Devosia euplotis]